LEEAELLSSHQGACRTFDERHFDQLAVSHRQRRCSAKRRCISSAIDAEEFELSFTVLNAAIGVVRTWQNVGRTALE
jgi:hypothetical protein